MSQYAQLAAAFDALLDGVKGVWPEASIAYVREIAGHREFDDALENFIALALRDAHPLDEAALRRVSHLATQLGLEESLHPLRLRGSRR